MTTHASLPGLTRLAAIPQTGSALGGGACAPEPPCEAWADSVFRAYMKECARKSQDDLRATLERARAAQDHATTILLGAPATVAYDPWVTELHEQCRAHVRAAMYEQRRKDACRGEEIRGLIATAIVIDDYMAAENPVPVKMKRVKKATGKSSEMWPSLKP